MSGDGGAVLTMPGIGAAYEIVLGDDGGLRYVDTEGVVLVGLDVEANSHVIAVSDPPVVLAPETVDGRRLGTPYARMVAALRALDPRAEVRLGQAADVDPA